MIEAIILAGTPRNKNRLIKGKNKFFVKIGDGYLGNIVVSALAEADVIDSIYISGNKSELEKIIFNRKVCRIIQEKGSFFVNALDAFYHTPNSNHLEKKVLYLACDIPFLNARAIEDFISNAPDADFVYPFCLKEDFEELFPRFKWPYLVSKEGQVKFGNIALVKPNKIKKKKLISRLFRLRKVAVSDRRIEEFANIPRVVIQAFKLCGVEGLEIVTRAVYLKYVATPLGFSSKVSEYLSLDRVAEAYSKILECDVRAKRTRFPEICFDIDNEKRELRYTVQNYKAIMAKIVSR